MVIIRQARTDQQKAALAGGISLMIMTIAALFSYGYIHGSLIVQGDAGATIQNIQSSGLLFKAEILGWLVILICDIVVAWAFYIVLKPLQPYLSLLGAWFRLIYTSVLGVAITSLLNVMHITGKGIALPAFTSDHLIAQTIPHLEAFESIWSFGLIIFGVHLLMVGVVAFRSTAIPKIVSILLLLAAVGYIAVHLSSTFLPQYAEVVKVFEYVFMLPMFAGEFGFGLWLLFKGGRS